jgi:hypothetical protein
MKLRIVVALGLLLSFVRDARAESRREYVRRAAIVLGAVVHIESWVERNKDDLGLCSIAQAVAERSVELANHLTPPPELRGLHPHLLMTIEHAERAYFFASSGDEREFQHHLRLAREERRILQRLATEEGVDLSPLD